MNLITEYLVIIEKSESEGLYHLCDGIEEFIKLLRKNPEIKITQNQIKYNNFNFPYELKFGNIDGKEQRFFHIKISFNGNEKDLDNYSEILRVIRITIGRAKGQIETLKDDISSFFANKSYPLIHNAENLMRKLITYFMLTNVGRNWVEEAVPESFKTAVDKSKRKEFVGVLHKVDFIHLGELLFNPYQTKRVADLYYILKTAQNVEELNLNQLKEFTNRSNWERYFSKIVECEDSYLDTRWKQLYELRCSVAHNAIITKSDYENIFRLVNEITPHVQQAIDNIDKVHIPAEEKERIVENVASNINALYGEFINAWKTLETVLSKSVSSSERYQKTASPISLLEELHVTGLIDDDLLDIGKYLVYFRNSLLQNTNISFNEDEVITNISRIKNLTKAINNKLSTEVNVRWIDEVLAALEALGGKASLSEIYSYIEQTTARELPENWDSNVRRSLYEHSSDVGLYKGKEDYFEHLGKGLWKLRTILPESLPS